MPLQSALPSPAERADTPAPAGGPAPAPATAWTDSGAAWRDAQYSPVKIDAVAQALAALGIAPQAALLQAGIQPGRRQDADHLTSTAQLYQLLLPELDDTLYRLLIEMQVTVRHTLATDVMGPWRQPTLLALRWAALPSPAGQADDSAWTELLASAPQYGTARGELRYPAAWLDRPPRLAKVRQALAEDCLRSTRMGLDDIAAALAFSDARSFRHAYTRWTGRSPSDFRRALACN